MLDRILSDDRPRSRAVGGLLLAALVLLLVFPFVFKGATAINAAAMVIVFTVLAASYDMLLGYTNVLSFAHAAFFGIGAYAVALTMKHGDASGPWLLFAVLAAMACAAVFAFLVGLLSLRVRALFFALTTLAVAAGFASVLESYYELTGGEDGLVYYLPRALSPGFQLLSERVPAFDLGGWLGGLFGAGSANPADYTYGVRANGKLVKYYLILAVAIAAFLLMLRVVNSPFGRVLQAIRENEFRVRAIGYNLTLYRTLIFCLGSAMAALAGALYAVWMGYVSSETAGFNVMIGILIMVVVGGTGTLYGALFGAVVLIVAENYLRDLVAGVVGTGLDLSLPLIGNILGELLHPNRWMMWMSLLYVLSVYFFSDGIVGTLRRRAQARRETSAAAPVPVLAGRG